MTKREEEILEAIKTDPMISQKDLALLLGITRSSVAVHVSSLMKKGFLKGRAYILNEEAMVTVVGGCNLDLQGISEKELKFYDSTPGRLTKSSGGVGRNIAENIARLDLPVRLLSALGMDEEGEFIRLYTEEVGVEMKDLIYSSKNPTSVYLSVLDEKGEMVVAINQMGILKEVDREYLQKKEELIKQASVIVIDANLEEGALEYLCKTHQDKKIFADPVSTTKCKKLKSSLKYLYAIKPNLLEMESLVGRKLEGMQDYKAAITEILDLGVKEIYLTLGKDGVLVADKNHLIHARGEVTSLLSVTGAGDAFLAAAVYSTLQGWRLDKLASFSQAVALLTLEQEKNDISFEEKNINKRREEVKTQSLPW